jgi:hypothetical protein
MFLDNTSLGEAVGHLNFCENEEVYLVTPLPKTDSKDADYVQVYFLKKNPDPKAFFPLIRALNSLPLPANDCCH